MDVSNRLSVEQLLELQKQVKDDVYFYRNLRLVILAKQGWTDPSIGLALGLRRQSPLRSEHVNAIPDDLDSRLQLLRQEKISELDHTLIWAPDIRKKLEQIVAEHERTFELLKGGLAPTRTAIFAGPPGVGKTLAARWLAQKLKRPLLTLYHLNLEVINLADEKGQGKKNPSPVRLKSREGRTIPIAGALLQILKSMPRDSEFVFHGVGGGKLLPYKVRIALKQEVIKPLLVSNPEFAGNEGFATACLHSFRHFFHLRLR